MIKSLLFVLLVVALISGQEDCNTLSCSDEFGKCTADYYVVPFTAPYTNTNQNDLIYCNSGFYCNFRNENENQYYGVCSKVGEEGDSCPYACSGSGCDTATHNTGCAIGLSCYGDGLGPSTCQYLSYLTLGEDCESDLQCVDGLRCDTMDTETCVANINQTVAETIICVNTNQCKANEYCDDGGEGDSSVCSPLRADGQSCGSTEECLPTSVCDINICTKALSKSVDSLCEQDLACDISQNLVCGGTDTCTALPAVPGGNCSSTGVSCGANNLCLCSGNQGSCVSTGYASPAQCKSAMTTFLQCVSDNGCQNLLFGGGFNPVAPDSCAYKNCGENYCNVVSNCQASNIGKCNSEVLVASICTSGSSMIQASIAMIVLALFALLF